MHVDCVVSTFTIDFSFLNSIVIFRLEIIPSNAIVMNYSFIGPFASGARRIKNRILISMLRRARIIRWGRSGISQKLVCLKGTGPPRNAFKEALAKAQFRGCAASFTLPSPLPFGNLPAHPILRLVTALIVVLATSVVSRKSRRQVGDFRWPATFPTPRRTRLVPLP